MTLLPETTERPTTRPTLSGSYSGSSRFGERWHSRYCDLICSMPRKQRYARRRTTMKRLLLTASLISGCVFFVCFRAPQGIKLNPLDDLSPSDEYRRSYWFERLPRLLPDVPYEVIAQPNFTVCRDASTDRLTMFIAVLSPAGAFAIRNAIRQSWASPAHSKSIAERSAVVAFVVGTVDDERVMSDLIAESKQYGDLLVTSFLEDYSNLTLKVYSVMKFVHQNCTNAKFFMKMDNDVILSVDTVMEKVRQLSPSSMVVYGGRLWILAEAIRFHPNKWYVPEDRFEGKYFPTYAGGPVYLMSRRAFEAIYAHLSNTSWITVEDAFFTGIVAERAGVDRTDFDDFFLWRRPKINVPSHWPCDHRGRPLLACIHGFKTPSEILNHSMALLSLRCGRMPYYMEATLWRAILNIIGLR